MGQITDALLENGTLTRPYLGIGTQQVHLNGKLADSVGQDRALLVVHIDEDSPAAAADLRLGDALIGLNDGAIHGVHDLLGALAELKAGSKVSLSILRAEAPMEVSATLGTRPGGGLDLAPPSVVAVGPDPKVNCPGLQLFYLLAEPLRPSGRPSKWGRARILGETSCQNY